MRRILAAVLLLTVCAFAQAQSGMRIQYAEPVSIEARTGSASFEAYGRRFDLDLHNNDRVTSKLSPQRKASLARYRIHRGTVAGQPRSWVRLTEFNGRVEGAIWDGQDLYAVTSHDRISAYLTAPVPAGPRQTVVYRLSDTINAFAHDFCAAAPTAPGDRANNGLVQYRALVAELQAQVAAAPVPLQIEISLIADAMFQGQFASDATGELLARHNVADGVFAEQVGLLVIPADLRLAPSAPDPFTSTQASTLLDQLSEFRRDNATVSSMGLAHLMTGHDLDGDTAGIAWIGGVCDVDNGVSLTESSLGSTIDGLIMAHELGHNFGAVHDGSGICAATPLSHIMAPNFNFSTTFSQCSLDTMRPVIESAACITPADYGDVALPAAGSELSVESGVPLVIPYVVSSAGTRTANNVSLTVSVPPEFTVTAASGASCTVSADAATCLFGDIPAGEDRTVDITVLPGSIGQFAIEAQVFADNNPSTHNDRQQQLVNILINSDAQLSMSASASTVLVGDTVDFTIEVESIRSHAVQGATVVFTHHLLQVDSASVSGGSCNSDSAETRCTLDDIPAGTSRTITIHSTAVQVGLAEPVATVSPLTDADSSNNFARLEVRVNPVRDVGMEEETPNIVSLFGQPFEFIANVRSNGAQPIDGVTLHLSISTPQVPDTGIESVTVGGVNCAPPSGGGSYECPLGTLAAGESRPVVISGTGVSLGTYAFSFNIDGTGDQVSSNNSLVRGVTIKNGVDVAVLSPNPVSITEGVEGSGTVTTVSNGAQAVSGAVLEVSAPESIRFIRFFLPSEKGSCSIVTDRRLRCELSFGENNASGFTFLNYVLVGNEPGEYSLTATIAAASDEVTDNDSMALPVTINPIINVGTQAFTGPQYLMVGSEATVTTSVVTGSRPVPGATAIVRASSGTEISSMTTAAGICTRVDAAEFGCDFGALPAGASVSLSVVLRGVLASSSSSLSINASAAGDNNQSDDIKTITFQVTDPGDLAVSGGDSVTATAGSDFDVSFGLNHTGPLVDGRLQISLPSGVELDSMSAGALICTGTSILECELSSWPEHETMQVDLTLRAEDEGDYTVVATVSSANDTDASNNESSVDITVNPQTTVPPPNPPSNPPSGGGNSGGGGGGSFDPTLLLALGVALVLAWRRRLACRICSSAAA